MQNRGAEGRRYRLEILASPPVTLIAPENPLDVAGGAHRTTALFVVAPTNSFHAGRREIVVRVADDHGFTADTPYRLVGPEEVP